MKFLFALLASCGLGFFVFLPASKQTDDQPPASPKEQILIKSILKELGDIHYRPKTIDDAFSHEIHSGFLASLDPQKKFLQQKDIDQLNVFQASLDDDAKNGNFDFFNQSLTLVQAGMAKAEKYCFQALTAKLKLNSKEQWQTNGDKLDYVDNDQTLASRWKKIVTHKVIENLYELESRQLKNGGTQTLKALQAEAVTQASNAFKLQFERLNRISRTERLGDYLNLFLTLHGPHNGYLTPKDKEKFDIQLSKSLKGIGARLVSENDQIKFTEIVPGGPAGNSKQLAINDLLLKITQEGETPVDVNGFAVDEVTALLRGEVGTKLTLTIKKPDGLIKEVALTRDLVIMSAGLARSFILEEESLGEKIGYIRLPRFYIDFSNDDGPRCARDIYKEVEKLKTSQVKGIIIDLRNNIGGSLRETLKMLGHFIEKGPLVQREAQDGSLRTLNDKDESFQYDGEIVVLVNKNSGSASELFSGTLQDYDRAVIVGSESTFGKGTVQRMRNLDETSGADSSLFPLGNLKITIGKFYRVSGASTQLRGVEPDIVLPDNNTFINIGEKAQKYPLPWTEIEPKEFSQSVNTNPNLAKVVARSKERVQNNQQFQLVLENAKRYKRLREETLVELDFDKFKQSNAQKQAEAARYENIFSDNPSLRISNNQTDLVAMESDELRKSQNAEWMASLRKDAYVEECLFIMHDLLTQVP